MRGMSESAISRILFPCRTGMAIIHLASGSPQKSSSLPKSIGRAALHPFRETLFYLTLLRVGFTMPPLLPASRCALTAPFHPYLAVRGGIFSVALSVGSPLPRVTRHTALWSSDFPRPFIRVAIALPTPTSLYSIVFVEIQPWIPRTLQIINLKSVKPVESVIDFFSSFYRRIPPIRLL
jgi:hypothetical protein